MHVIMAFNTGFLLPALTTIYSLFNTNSGVRLHILYADLSDSAKTVLKRLEGVGTDNRVEFLPVEGELLERIKVATGRWRAECFFRYYCIEMLPDLDKVLWLDADTLVRKNAEGLYNTDLEGRSFGAVFDDTSKPKERLGISDYYNSGVLLIDAKKLRETGKMKDFWELIASPDYKGDLPDQDALNIVFKDDIKEMGGIYNTFPLNPDEYADFLIENAVIIHYVSEHKPWNTEEVKYFNECFKVYRTSEVFITEYWEACGRAVAFIG
ncbi:MAG: glycosyltransferase family 8 protein [Lachnospiraceae bacterium]|nr:glycosyltransferase family 8 protein [Lachnospiraceae bacterium]